MEAALNERDGGDSSLPVELSWTQSQESILAAWSDQAAGMHWMHVRAESQYQKLHYMFLVPIITLSTVTGSTNFTLPSFVGSENQLVAAFIIGGLSLVSAFLSGLSHQLRIPQTAEAHRAAALSWGKFHRMVRTELALRRDQRINCMDFIKFSRQEFDRLHETSPIVPENIRLNYRREIGDAPDVKLPDICNGIEHTQICQEVVPTRGPQYLARGSPLETARFSRAPPYSNERSVALPPTPPTTPPPQKATPTPPSLLTAPATSSSNSNSNSSQSV